MITRFERAYGCLAGVVLGDALGRASEFMTREQIRERFGWLDDFAAPSALHPGAADPLGSITDDATQTLLIAQTFIEHGRLTPENVAQALVNWARANDGLNNPYLGPSTRRALKSLMEGASPRETGGSGNTNGSAMRVAAIGIVNTDDEALALADAIAASAPTHDTHNGIQGAAAAAFAIGAAMQADGNLTSMVAAAGDGARRGRQHGKWSWATPLDKRIELADILARKATSLENGLQEIYDWVGVGLDPSESVAAAIGVAVLADGDPMRAIYAGINIGGDTDTIASLAGGICGALRGIGAIDAGKLHFVEQVNHLNVAEVTRRLLAAQTGATHGD